LGGAPHHQVWYQQQAGSVAAYGTRPTDADVPAPSFPSMPTDADAAGAMAVGMSSNMPKTGASAALPGTLKSLVERSSHGGGARPTGHDSGGHSGSIQNKLSLFEPPSAIPLDARGVGVVAPGAITAASPDKTVVPSPPVEPRVACALEQSVSLQQQLRLATLAGSANGAACRQRDVTTAGERGALRQDMSDEEVFSMFAEELHSLDRGRVDPALLEGQRGFPKFASDQMVMEA